MSAWASFAPTPAELAYVAKLFERADPQKLGIITGDAAVPVLAGSTLPPDKLGEIWTLADHDNNGFLSKKGVAVAVRLIAWAQRGEPVTEALLAKPGPLPSINGIVTPGNSLDIASRATSPPPGVSPIPTSVPLLGAPERTKYYRLFVSSGPQGGLLNGDKARDVFIKSRLSVDKLGQIWNLADTHNRGSLDSTDFAVAMHLIQACMSNPAFQVPDALPAGLYEQASGGKPLNLGGTGSAILQPQSTGGSFASVGSPNRSAFVSQGPIKPQYTGQRSQILPQGTGNQLQAQFSGQPFASPSPSASAFPSSASSAFVHPQTQWAVSPEEKAKADGFFNTLDKQRRGFIEGDVAVPFMLESKLPESDLATVWDLADLSNDGKLTKEGFAVALHLINDKLAGRDIPSTLPPSLVPPGMRTGSANATAARSAQSEIQRDLWDLSDDTPVANTVPVASPASTARAFSPAPVASLTPSITGASVSSPFGAPFAAGPRKPTADLLSDDEDEAEPNTRSSSTGPSQSLAIANMKNQLESTERSLTRSKSDRTNLEAAVSDSASQLAQLETQLASAKAQFDTETRLIGDLQKRQQDQLENIRKTREELIRAESDLSALRAEKAEVEGSVLRDKEEIRELQGKLKVAGDDTTSLKGELEKNKKDARQQKGMLAIAKKQLATAEEAVVKVRAEIEATKSEHHAAVVELDATNASIEKARIESEQLAAAATKDIIPEPSLTGVVPSGAQQAVAPPASIPLPVTPDVQSPAASTKSNNPFGRLFGQNTGSVPGSPSAFPSSTLPKVANAEPAAVEDASVVKDADPFDTAFGVTDRKSPQPEAELDATEPQAVAVGSLTADDAPKAAVPDAEREAKAIAPVETVPLSEQDPVSKEAATFTSQPENDPSEGLVTPGAVGPEVSAASHPAAKDKVPADDEDSSDDEGVEEADASHRPANKAIPGAFPDVELPMEAPTSATTFATAEGDADPQSFAKGGELATSTSSAFDNAFSASATLPPTTTPAPPAGAAAFDDAFGPQDPEAKSTAPSQPPNGAKPFAFETSFDDTFDFGGSQAIADPKTQISNPGLIEPQAANGHTNGVGSFDDAFGMSGTAPKISSSPFKSIAETPSSSPFTTLPPPPSVSRSGTTRRKSVIPGGPAPVSASENTPSLPTNVTSDPFGSTPSSAAAPVFQPPPGPPPGVTPDAPATSHDTTTTGGFSFDDAFSVPRDIPPFDHQTQSAVYPEPAPQHSPLQNVDEDDVPLALAASRNRAPHFSADRPLSTMVSSIGGERSRDADTHSRRRSISSVDRSRMSSSPPPEGGKADGSGKSKSKLASFFGRGKNKDKPEKESKGPKKGVSPLVAAPSNVDEFGSNAPVRSASFQGHGPSSRSRRQAVPDVIGEPVGPDDDVAAVKRLVDMGFTRGQAVDALERNSYDVPAALNSLLGAA